MDLRSGILSTAQALGINPLDLATAISYETAGTFDPTKAGPTTQWGQHRGLIQFGEPQAKKYGVDWANPVASQLGPQGAVANYLRDTGVKPGMGLLDIYSAINAGGVGRYNRSDANNGGAPGTVRDKVEKQMSGHRQKAMSLLGQIDQPQTLSTSSPQTEAAPMQQQKATGLLGSLFPNMSADRQDRLAVALSGLSMHPSQGIVQMAGQRMSDRREDSKEAQAKAQEQQQTNRTIAWLETQAPNNPNAAQALQMLAQGVIDPRGALQLAMQKGERTKYEYNEDLGGFIDPYNPQAGLVNVPGVTGQPKIDVEGESALRKEYIGRADVKSFKEQADAFGRIRAAAEQPDAAGDLALIFNYMKLLDPGSVVREGEFATAQNAAGIDDRTRNVWNRLQTGERLSPEQRQEFVSRAGRIYEGAREQNSSTERQYQDTAQQYGYDPQRAIPDVNYQSPYAPQQTPVRPQARTAPQPSQPGNVPTQDQLKSAISQLSPYDVQLMQSIPGAGGKIDFLRSKGLLP